MTSYGKDQVIDMKTFSIGKLILGGFALVLLLILLFNSVTTIPAGHIGVLTLFGRVTD